MKWVWQEIVVPAMMVLIPLSLWLGFMFWQGTQDARRTTCVSSVKMLAFAMKVYAADNEERLPTGPWSDVFWSERCPNDRSPNDPSYALHERWLLDPLPVSPEAEHLILLYESSPQPFAYRHFMGMNVGFVDGHVRFHKKARLTPEHLLSGRY